MSEPAHGFRIATRGRPIAPSEDIELCEIGELPGPPQREYHLGAIETASLPGSHHIVVSLLEPGSPADLRAQEQAPGAQIRCLATASELGREGLITVATAQTPYSALEYPPGVGLRAHGGQRVVFNYHYINLEAEPITAKVAVAVHLLDAGEPIAIASAFSFNNMTIDTPPGTERTFTATCAFDEDVMLSDLSRHTHAHGTAFSVWFAGGARHGEPIWTSRDWEHELHYRFAAPILVEAGEGFSYACTFFNDGEQPLRYGIRASDEMCILAGTIWSPEPGRELVQRECAITWIDEQGIGHPADAAGGFPNAKPLDASACHVSHFGISLVQPCLGCMCNACGTVLAQCNADADCKPLLDCTNSCRATADCSEQCKPVVLEHSSAVGMYAQVGECLRSRCTTRCTLPFLLP